MNFLEQYWGTMQQPQKELGCPSGAIGTDFWRPWVSDLSNINMILHALQILTPCKVVETGTYEGLTTLEMAKIVDIACKNKGIIGEVYTFDTLGPVSCYSDGKTESTDWGTNPQWKGWDKLVEIRKQRLNTFLNNCKIEFIVGLTQDTLPVSRAKLKNWDFWYQDSVHDLDLIIGEWGVMEEVSKIGSVVAFDDIISTHPLRTWFPENNHNWIYRIAEKDSRSQLWAERIK